MQYHLARRCPKLPSSALYRALSSARAVATYDFVVVGGGAAGRAAVSIFFSTCPSGHRDNRSDGVWIFFFKRHYTPVN